MTNLYILPQTWLKHNVFASPLWLKVLGFKTSGLLGADYLTLLLQRKSYFQFLGKKRALKITTYLTPIYIYVIEAMAVTKQR